jgi:hypothetical protein
LFFPPDLWFRWKSGGERGVLEYKKPLLHLRRGGSQMRIPPLIFQIHMKKSVGISTFASSSLAGCWASQGLVPPPLLIRVFDSIFHLEKQYMFHRKNKSRNNYLFF